ncbi:hypothetical protein [Streptomyces sp. McG3]|uniref:hypothetical protein n=1 Tax=Streptomyces sp. McG3 TaxID=2725483 RepID=UPI001BE659D4|nr:hypothetical protein [Streptomyces sp. McG3]MBT2895724.1 hypothetical protein [Streptomyces sp. McG3]
MRPPRGPGDTAVGDRAELVPPGSRIGDWVVTGPIGTGGWSTVYAARPAGSRPGRAGVALKIMPTAGLAPLQARRILESARREAELGRGGGHPRALTAGCLAPTHEARALHTPESLLIRIAAHREAPGARRRGEEDRRSTRWFRVRLPAGPEPRTAWLPAVRAEKRPALPDCS